ncbi:MAG: hypothetical protein J0M28_14240, partial [Thauera sp.]|nr:hypothetical protein [Thauera sp.]
MLRATALTATSLAFLLPVCSQPVAAAIDPPAASVVEAPGPDLPPAGRSLFDELIEAATDSAVRVPFPFPALLRVIARELDAGQPSGGVSVVLIPLGRSLQRHAAGDLDAFRYPRVVAAVTGEPPPAAAPGHLYLRDRLYVAYHEKAAALEVISYNEAAGRFEFQLVHDYREGGTPQVGYASRTLCLACHHGAAPIFSRQSWDETSASAAVAARLAATGLSYYGLPWRHGVDIPDAIDTATARANLLGTTQRLWREGCASQARDTAVTCRAEALRLALRHRLTEGRSTTAQRLAGRPALVEPLLANWRQRWPDGLAIPDPSLPNRQPFAGIEGGRPLPSDAELRLYADISAAFDPLALRAPLETWPGRSAADAGRFVGALAMAFSRADIALIDRRLRALAASGTTSAATVSHVHLSCSARRGADQGRVDLDCEGDAGARLQARLLLKDSVPARGRIDRLVLPGNDALGALDAVIAPRHAAAGRFRLVPTRPVRAAGGDAIRHINLDWPQAQAAAGAVPAAADIELTMDLAPLDAAIDRLAEATLGGRSDALDAQPLRRAATLPPLLAAIGVPQP